jgi:hypothetical protein
MTAARTILLLCLSLGALPVLDACCGTGGEEAAWYWG